MVTFNSVMTFPSLTIKNLNIKSIRRNHMILKKTKQLNSTASLKRHKKFNISSKMIAINGRSSTGRLGRVSMIFKEWGDPLIKFFGIYRKKCVNWKPIYRQFLFLFTNLHVLCNLYTLSALQRNKGKFTHIFSTWAWKTSDILITPWHFLLKNIKSVTTMRLLKDFTCTLLNG